MGSLSILSRRLSPEEKSEIAARMASIPVQLPRHLQPFRVAKRQAEAQQQIAAALENELQRAAQSAGEPNAELAARLQKLELAEANRASQPAPQAAVEPDAVKVTTEHDAAGMVRAFKAGKLEFRAIRDANGFIQRIVQVPTKT